MRKNISRKVTLTCTRNHAPSAYEGLNKARRTAKWKLLTVKLAIHVDVKLAKVLWREPPEVHQDAMSIKVLLRPRGVSMLRARLLQPVSERSACSMVPTWQM